ncbi:MAG: FtsB family cell division protein [Thermodesulfovibrionales bacterium]
MGAKDRRLRDQVTAEQKRKRWIGYTVFVLVAGYLLVTYLFHDMGLIKYFELKGVERDLMAEISALETKNSTLQSEIGEMKSNPFFIEKHARENLNMSKPDEFVFIYDR